MFSTVEVSTVYHLSRNYLIMNYSFNFTVLSPRQRIDHNTPDLILASSLLQDRIKKLTSSLNGFATKYTADMVYNMRLPDL